MEQSSSSGDVAQITLETLPVEVLVYIVSFLRTREKVAIRCVSKALRSVSEVPSLWEEFFWSRYAPRDEKLLKHLFKMFGKHIQRLRIVDHIAQSKLEVMLKHCKNMVDLAVPSLNCYGKHFERLKNIVHGMTSIQTLDILGPTYLDDGVVQQIFTLSSNLKELTINYGSFVWRFHSQMRQWLEGWVKFRLVPRKINIVFSGNPGMIHRLRLPLQSSLPKVRSKKSPTTTSVFIRHIAQLNICFKPPAQSSPTVPIIQVQITNSAVLMPSVKASKYGLLGLDSDILHLTEGSYRGRKVHRAMLVKGVNERHIDTSVTSLTFVTHFDASCCKDIYPGHLEQLSIACPNLQRLNLFNNANCLNNLQGLRSLSNNCKNLQGLNLKQIHFSNGEYDCLQLWEVLCTMPLTQLAIEAWVFNVCGCDKRTKLSSSSEHCSVETKQQKLIDLFKGYTSLQVLEVQLEMVFESSYDYLSDKELMLVSYFPSITSYRLSNLPSNNCCYTLKRIFSCKYLRCLFLSKSTHGILSLSSEGGCSSLQQLYIHSRDTFPSETFIDALSSHRGLEHVILCVRSLTAKSINSIVEHSPSLVIFHVILYSRSFLNNQLKEMMAAIRTKFSKRRLFNGGNFDIKQVSYHSSFLGVNDNALLCDTDLLSVWESN